MKRDAKEINWIEVATKREFRDVLGEKTLDAIRSFLGLQAREVRTLHVYTIKKALSPEQLQLVGKESFTDAILDEFVVNAHLAEQLEFDWLIEVGFKPGVTDNLGKTARSAIEDTLNLRFKDDEDVFSATQYLIKGQLTRDNARRIALELLGNSLIQNFTVLSHQEWQAGKYEKKVPVVKISDQLKVEHVDLELSDQQLERLSRERVLAMTLEELKSVRDYLHTPQVQTERAQLGLTQKPTDVELECIAQTWSEHCKHKIFNARILYRILNKGAEKPEVIDGLFASYIKKATQEIGKKIDWLVSVFSDNAGIIKFNDQYNLTFKVETHNSPSALDPYGGALTGIVGVNRDPLGTGRGSRLIANTNVFCFAPPDYDQPIPERLLHPHRVLEGVRKGVEDGGNKSGIPTVNGCLVFDQRYLGKPLVYCGTIGIMPSQINHHPTHIKEIEPGDLIVIAGGRTGKDGIHGATFSSEELHEGSPATAVQIGDPFTQKKMADFLVIARDQRLFRTLTDNGAGGFSSSVGEISRLSNGCRIQLEKAPLKYSGLQPWEIFLSESQERMTLAVPPKKMATLKQLADHHEVELAVIGEFTDTGKLHVLYKEQTVAYLDLPFLHEGVPQMELEAEWKAPAEQPLKLEDKEDYGDALKSVLSSLNVCSKEYVVRQYDHEVQGGSIIKPLTGVHDDGPSDASVMIPLEAMCEGSFEGIAVSNGICPKFSDFDTYHMAANALDEAVRNLVAVGASLKQVAILDNFCWPDPVYHPEKTPDGKYKLAQLVRANKALYDYALLFGTPFISGKDSMKNDYKIGDTKISVPPTILISAVAKLDDVRKCVTMDVKHAGDLVYMLGETRDELAGSEYFNLLKLDKGLVPRVDGEKAKKLYQALSQAIAQGLVSSCHDCSDGGLAVALAESAFAGGLGMTVDLRKVPFTGEQQNYAILFSETPSRFVVTVSPHARKEFEKIIAENAHAEIGVVEERPQFVVTGIKGSPIIKEELAGLKQVWQQTLNW